MRRVGAAQPAGALDDGGQHRVGVAGRPADRGEHLVGGVELVLERQVAASKSFVLLGADCPRGHDRVDHAASQPCESAPLDRQSQRRRWVIGMARSGGLLLLQMRRAPRRCAGGRRSRSPRPSPTAPARARPDTRPSTPARPATTDSQGQDPGRETDEQEVEGVHGPGDQGVEQEQAGDVDGERDRQRPAPSRWRTAPSGPRGSTPRRAARRRSRPPPRRAGCASSPSRRSARGARRAGGRAGSRSRSTRRRRSAPSPARPSTTMSVVQPSSMSAPSAAVVPSSPSPRAMITIRPYRSAMWWPCHGVPPSLRLRDAPGRQLDPDSTSRTTTTNVQPVVRSASSSSDPADLRDQRGCRP